MIIIRLIWRIVDHSGVDVTEEIVKEVNQEDSWTAGGQVWGSQSGIHDPDPDPDLHPDPDAERSKVLNFRFPGLVQRGDHSDKKSFNKQAFGRMQVLNISCSKENQLKHGLCYKATI